MRSILAGALGLSLGIGGLMAQEPSNPLPAATLGRPIPAAVMGRPTALSANDSAFQPAGFRSDRPVAASMATADTTPLLAPVMSNGVEPLGGARPLPTDGNPGSSAAPPAPTPMPMYNAPAGPNYGPVGGYALPAADGCGPDGYPCVAGAPFMGAAFGPDWGMRSNLYCSAEFLMLFVPTIQTPLPLALQSPTPFNGVNLPPDVTVAIGNTDLSNPFRLGFRVGGGIWLDPCHRNAIDANFFLVGPSSRDFATEITPAFPTLIRPYTVVNTPNTPPPLNNIPGRPNFGDLVSLGPTGNVLVNTYSLMLGADVNWRRQLLAGCGYSVDLLVGFRYLHLDESITISENGTDGAGTPLTLTDRFQTINNFYGYQIGMVAQKQWGRWSADLSLKIASGPTPSTVDVTGSNNFDPARPGFGLFVQDSNSGRYNSSNWSIVPEVGLNIGFQVTPRMRAHIGYMGLYWSNVLRPGDQIDPIVDATKVPQVGGAVAPFDPLPAANPHPVIPFRRSDFYAHGLQLGLTFRW